MKSIKSNKYSPSMKLSKEDIVVEKIYDFDLEDEQGQKNNIVLYKEVNKKVNNMKKLNSFNGGD